MKEIKSQAKCCCLSIQLADVNIDTLSLGSALLCCCKGTPTGTSSMPQCANHIQSLGTKQLKHRFSQSRPTAALKKELSYRIMIIWSTVKTCRCQGLLRVHESLRNTLPAHTHIPMQCHSECSLEICPPFNQALTNRIGNAQETEQGGRRMRGRETGEGVCTVFAACWQV